MTILKKMGALALLLCLFFTACKEDPIVDPKTEVPAYEIPVQEVIASLTGVVLNEAGDALEGATVEVGNATVLTDENGVFIFKGLKMNALGTLVKVGKPGYFLGAQMVGATAGDRSNAQFVLMTKEVIGTVAAVTGGSVTTSDNGKITLPANGIATSSGDIYSGEVSVAARWIDPTSDELAAIMPGDLRAIDATQEAVQLATYGMLAVELEGAAGEALNIAEGSTAELEFPVPASLRADAPSTIPLWHFDEATGYWVEEGEAVFDGEKYVGSVSHFSFWNCDAPFPVVQLDGSVVDANGGSLGNVLVKITVNSSAIVRSGLLDVHGGFSGKIPKDEELTISLHIYGVCSEVLYTEVIGPFSDDVTLAPIVLDLTGSPTVKSLDLDGQLENCAGDIIIEGYIKMTFDGSEYIYWPNDAGLISGGFLHCSSVTSLELVGYDIVEEKKSDELTLTIPADGVVDFGALSVCEAIVEKIDYSIDGDEFTVFDPSAVLDMGILSVSGYGPDSATVELQIMASAPGVYQPEFAVFTGITNNTFPYSTCQGAAACADFDVTIIQFGAVGELVEGTFSGTMDGTNSGPSTVTGSFKAILE